MLDSARRSWPARSEYRESGICHLELGRLRYVDLRRTTLLYAHLGHKLVVNAYPTGEPLRNAGQVRLLERFNARLAPI